jgi:hypothetical protein
MLAMILFIGLPFLGFFLGSQYQLVIDRGRFSVTQLRSPEDKVSSWKLLSDEIGFTFRYPQNLTEQEQAGGVFALLTNPNNPDSIAYYVDERQVEVKPQKGAQEIVFRPNGKRIAVGCFGEYCDSPVFGQILSSFTFSK